jgi:hypothetical protein
MSDVPAEVLRLVQERDAARSARDFATADALRARIRENGFEVTDGPDGSTVARANEPPEARPGPEPAEMVRLLDEPVDCDASVHWLPERWPEDVERGMRAFRRHAARHAVQHVVVETEETRATRWPEHTDVVRLPEDTGWAAARNAGLMRSRGRVVIVADGSVEVTGDAVAPLLEALADPEVGIVGPYGIRTRDLRSFEDAPGPDVDAIEGYLLAVRRELIAGGLRFDERFRFYRMADVDLSFQVKAMGLRAVVTPVPLVRREHRRWTTTPAPRRDALSKRNFYRFLERWRGRFDLTVTGAGRPTMPDGQED